MSTAVTVLIIAIVVIEIIALVRRSKKQQHQKSHIGLPDLGALSTDGLDKQHASAPRALRIPWGRGSMR